MNAFHEKLKVEERSTAILRPFFESRGWTFGPHYPAFDERGDYPVSKGEIQENWEFKAETHERPTLFIEFMSNVGTGRLGWFYTLACDRLVYHFLNTNVAHVIDFPALQKLDLSNYRVVKQEKSEQNNITYGWSVFIAALEAEGVLKSYELNQPAELAEGTGQDVRCN